MQNFKVCYEALDKDDRIIKTGEIIAKRKMSEFDALAGTENYLKRKVDGMVRMRCKWLYVESLLGWIPTGETAKNQNPDDFLKSFFGL